MKGLSRKQITIISIITLFFLAGCSSQKQPSNYSDAVRQMNSTRMKALTNNQDKSKNKRALNSAKGKETEFDVEPYNAFTDVRRDQKRRRLVDLDKPQHSDPTYFGHKRKPKKRKRGKQKVCKECGIKH